MRATKRQIGAIHVLKSKLRMDDGDYREMLREYGVSSSKNMLFEHAQHLIERLVAIAGPQGLWEQKARSEPQNGWATPAQRAKTQNMWNEVAREPGEKTLNKFLANHFNVQCLRWMPDITVAKVIHTLRAMKQQKERSDVIHNIKKQEDDSTAARATA